MQNLLQVDAMKLFAVAFGSISVALPLGNIIHQVTDTVFNPFKLHRLLWWPRASVIELQKQLENGANKFRDSTFQAIMVFSKAWKVSNNSDQNPCELDVETLREEISNRYSYYYARIENGAVAPLCGLALSLLVRQLFWSSNFITVQPSFPFIWLVGLAVLIGLIILWRIPQLFRELDDIEVALLNFQRTRWAGLDPGAS